MSFPHILVLLIFNSTLGGIGGGILEIFAGWGMFNERIHRYIFNDSRSAGLRPDRNDCKLNVQEEIQKVYIPKTR